MRDERADDTQGLLASIVDTSVDGIVGLDLDGSVLVWNQGAERMYGWSADEMVGGSIKAIVPDLLHGEIEFLMTQVARGDVVRDLLTQRRRKDGRVIDISLSASPIRASSGAIVGMVKTERDITQRRREEAISEGQRQMLEALTRTGKLSDGLQALLQSLASLTEVRATSVVRRVEPDRGVLVLAAAHLQPAVRRLFRRAIPVGEGGHPAGHAAYTCEAVSVPDLDEASSWDASDAIEAGLRSLHTVPIVALNGEVLGTLDLYGHEPGSLPPEDRAVMTSLAQTAALVMDRFRVLRELQTRRVFLEAVNRLNGILATQIEVREILESVCEACTQLLGSDVGAFYYDPAAHADHDGYRTRVMAGERPELLEALTSARRRVLLQHAQRQRDVCRFKDVTREPWFARAGADEGGTPSLRSLVLVPLHGRNSGELGVLMLGHEESGRFGPWHGEVLNAIASQTAFALENARLFEETRERARAMAEADRHKNRFLAALGHELRNPLSAIRASFEILEEHLPREGEVRDVGDVLRRQVRHMGRLVDDLLDLGRIMRGEIPVRHELADLRLPVERAVEGARTYAAGSDVCIELRMPEHALHARIDATRIEQVVGNLLHNAVKFAPDTTVRVDVGTLDDVHQITVTDEGIGIEPERQADIFQLFTQVRGTETEGLGMGLALVQQLVSLHGGTIEVHSAGRGEGARFDVRLPASRESAPEAPATDATPATDGAPPSLRVLLVEDDEDAAFAMTIMLERWTHEVLRAGTGVQALALTDDWQPDVAVLDIGLPDMDGWDVAQALRERFGGDLRIAALSGRGHDADRGRSASAGIDTHFVKPVDPPRLKAWIEGR